MKSFKLAPADIGILLGFIGLMFYIYLGFYYPDPLFQSGRGNALILWALRLGVPCVTLAVVCLYVAIRTRRVPSQIGLLVAVGAVLGAGVGYPLAADIYYGQTVKRGIKGYHPYLQLAPNDWDERPPTTGKEPLVIVCLGGSTTAWPDSAGRDWPSRVEELLRDAVPGRTIEVHNQGREWYTSQHALINYSLNIHHRRPHLLLVMHALNDLSENVDFNYIVGGPFREDYRHFYGPVAGLVARKTFTQVVADKFSTYWYHSPRRLIATDNFPGLVPFKRNLTTLVQLAGMNGTQVILMTEPNLFKPQMSQEEQAVLYLLNFVATGRDRQWDLKTARTGMGRYNDTVRALARELNLALIDLEPVVPKTLEYFRDEVHYQDRAFPLVAETVAAQLKLQGMLTRAGSRPDEAQLPTQAANVSAAAHVVPVS